MKKFFALFLAVLTLLCGITACEAGPADDGKLKIVTTIFPEYDWVRQILGDKAADAELTMLLDNGVDLHSFQPTVEDILKISTCDLFLYVGGESDEWVEDALQEATNQEMKVLNLLDILGDGAREEELVEGMQGEEEEEEGGEEEGPEYDEHVWLSLKNAKVFVRAIEDALCGLDADNADAYRANADSYIASIDKLDAEYLAAVGAGSFDTLLFGDRFPFRYLTEDYGLKYYAAFIGCSAETEASFQTITFLAGKMDELGLHTVLALEGSDCKIAETIVRNTAQKNQQILQMDSLQSVTSKNVGDGVTYLSVMESNLRTLKEALK